MFTTATALAAVAYETGKNGGSRQKAVRKEVDKYLHLQDDSIILPEAQAEIGFEFREDIKPRSLNIPAINLPVSPVQDSIFINGESDLRDDSKGVFTPKDNLLGLENKSWIFGHSSHQYVPGKHTPDLLYDLADLNIGDEIYIDGVDRENKFDLGRLRYVVSRIVLIDKSGALHVLGNPNGKIPNVPRLLIQTSVRQDKPGADWLPPIPKEVLEKKAEVIVEGDIDDPAKYLLLFVMANLSSEDIVMLRNAFGDKRSG